MSLKAKFQLFVKQEFNHSVMGVASVEDYSVRELNGIKSLIAYFSKLTAVPDNMKTAIQPGEFLGDKKSIIVLVSPNYMERPKKISECRADLLGTASPIHITNEIMISAKDRSSKTCSFFSDRGLSCEPAAASLVFPLKIMAVRAGLGYYGKNSMVISPGLGSWISLSAFMTDAVLEPDVSFDKDCGDCDKCIKACPAGALSTPYSCDESKCINFHLPHNKGDIPRELRPYCRNFIGSGCSVCRDVCPENKKLTPVPGLSAPPELLHPHLLDIVDMDDAAWKKGYARTLTGMSMQSKRYLQRNAAIALGNFKDERAIEKLAIVLKEGDKEVRAYAAWALGMISSETSFDILEQAFKIETDKNIKDELSAALEMK